MEKINSENGSLLFHVREVAKKQRRFETAAQSVSRMILEKGLEKRIHAGRTVYDFNFFRQGKKHLIGWYDEINDFVHFIKDAAEGGSAAEMGFVLVGEPGNGKTFFVDYICEYYRRFLALPENRRFTFKFTGLDKALGYNEKVAELESLTFEDPMIMALNLFEERSQTESWLIKAGFGEKYLEELFDLRRSLGASSEYLLYALKERFGGDIEKCLEYVKVFPVPMRESLGTVTGKYSAGDKITSSGTDLKGEESLQHLLLLGLDDPNKFDLKRGALARVAGSGIHFADELFRNKKDLVQIYLQVIQNRIVEISAFIWPIDVLIIGTSNNDAFNQFISDKDEAPIHDRCRICYVSHNTDHRIQMKLTSYIIGGKKRTTVLGSEMHEDPNLNYAASVSVVLTRLPLSEKLTPVETMKLAAGETAGEKGNKTLKEVIDTVNANPDVTKRWGQGGIGYRNLGKTIQILAAMHESNEGKCLFAKDVFKAFERIILDYVPEASHRDKFMQDLKIARKLYREQIKTAIFNAYRDDPQAIRKDVMSYVNMVIGMDAENLGPDKMWKYKDPQTGEIKPIKIDTNYINSVEKRLGLATQERHDSFRNTIRKIYGQKVATDPNYDFMDNQELVKAVTDVRLESDVAGAGSLVGALANRTNEENVKIYNRMIKTMLEKLGYCLTCASGTIEYYCEKEDES
ncbi:MAG: serine protein kinase PrkA [bacterium]|nr:serine protein kinase PrkA [bacterium]